MRTWIAAALVIAVGVVVGSWLDARRRRRNLTPSWLNETAYDKRGDY